MGAETGERFSCGCGAEITFTSACTCEGKNNPVCVCGMEMTPVEAGGASEPA